MDREILFRGKMADDGAWVEGDYIASDFISPWKNGELYVNKGYADGMEWGEGCFYRIAPSTIGQYTGLTDKNDAKIFEGDECRVSRSCVLAYGKITFASGCFWFVDSGPGGMLRLCDIKPNGFEITVIGNIHDQTAPSNI